ncbi:MAG: hypothetical protein A2589_00985 [Candidatus Vogelbacteria bacterium RIFOXYD1_FULL_46_19]|uniref:ABC transmembrane type-1 domain-containing protein n=1 Tax=Candidatus Vogelbacteria bacterium RIFOXYD1_FULL_46_19 TaxID=1802439 RepID=A0A1G2QFP3_9BACT|nr:MAG: hypothetical protein A2589_00985 [Candidatus Vogelbacteria bacterium RIFOXYD1_FULL_46_19]
MQNILKKLIVLVVILFLWQLLSSSIHTIIPSPIEVFTALYNLSVQGDIFIHIFASLKRVVVGFLIATFLGVGLALITGYYKKIDVFLKPLVEFLRPIPPIAWIPIAILIFGLGDMSAYFIVFIGAFFPIFTNSFFGVSSLPVIYENIAHSFEIKNFIFVKDILFKFSLPYIFTGLKIGIGMAWMSVIAAELIGAQSGLGYFIQLNRLLLRTDNVIAGMILIGFIGYMLSLLLLTVEKIIIPWSIKK